MVNQNCEVLACYAGDFNEAAKQYNTVVKLQFESDDDVNKFISKQAQLLKSSKQPSPTIVFKSDTKTRLHDVFFEKSEYAGAEKTFKFFAGLSANDDDNVHPFLTAKMKIIDVPRYDHFDEDEYPECISYFMYGDAKKAFLFHGPTKAPDFFQVRKSKANQLGRQY